MWRLLTCNFRVIIRIIALRNMQRKNQWLIARSLHVKRNDNYTLRQKNREKICVFGKKVVSLHDI